jgi:DNA-binding response OmpR family regulator
MDAPWSGRSTKLNESFGDVRQSLSSVAWHASCEFSDMQLNDYVLVIADDDAAACLALGATLEAKGFTVHTCGDGLRALELCQEVRPAVALLELDMPLLNGYETARRIRADTALAKLRVIAVTNHSDERSSALAWEAGFHDFLGKPVPISMLLAMVRPTRAMQGIVERS